MNRKRETGFTLIELLVVIAVIAVLMGILMPALNRAREMGKRAVCLNNTKALAFGWTMYCGDYEGRMPFGRAFEEGSKRWGWVLRTKAPYLTTPVDAPPVLQIEAIENGQLYKYVPNVKVFRCPVANKGEMRTYSTCAAANANGWSPQRWTLRNLNTIKQPATRMLFIDDFGENWDACWMIPRERAAWWNPVPMRHGMGTVLSFFDGHSSFWAWKEQETRDWASMANSWEEAEKGRNTKEMPDNLDLLNIQRAVWGDDLDR